jgi:hypothetical protein
MQKIAKAISANDLFKEMRQKHIELKNKFEKSEKLLSQLRGPGFMEINIK